MALPAQPEATKAWHAIETELRAQLGDSSYEIWFSSVEPQTWDGTLLVLKAPAATRTWISGRFGPTLETCAKRALGPTGRVSFGGDGEPREPRAPTSSTGSTPSSFNPRYCFEQFIIGEGNRLAHAASLAVSELPGQAYNPLFIYAPPGLGKTHLLHAIGNYVLTFGGGATVCYTTAEAFTNHFITALNSKSLETF